MDYAKLAELYENLSSTTKRLRKIEILADFLKHLKEEDSEVTHLILGRIYPEYDEKRIGVSNQIVVKAIARASGATPKQVTSEWKKIGDLGEVAEELMKVKKQSTLHQSSLDTKKILTNLRKLPELEGKGSIDRKISLITELLTSSTSAGAKYLTRIILGDLRIGTQESTVRDALSLAFFERDKKATKKIQDALDKSNDIEKIFEISKKKNLRSLENVSLQIGKPIKAMLAQKVKTIEEGFKNVGKPAAIEYKYDGFRLIIHKKDEKVTLFTRRLENVTKQFPEVVEYINKYVKGDSFILDSEAVGYYKKTKEYRPFQEISQRIRRKYDIEKLQKELPVEINVFDVIYYNGKSLINEPFEKRSKKLREIVKNQKYKIITSKQIITGDEKKTEKFYKRALEDKQEGIMMKNLKAGYQPGRRVGHMLKIKPEERDVDLVITGAEYGTGKRSGWMSSFILSCKKGKDYLEIGKVGTGIKEKSTDGGGVSFEELTKKLTPYIIKEKGRSVEIKPKIVVAVTYQEIQRSPTYKSGFALRFPRVTGLRPDKSPSDSTTLEEIEKDYKKQRAEISGYK